MSFWAWLGDVVDRILGQTPPSPPAPSPVVEEADDAETAEAPDHSLVEIIDGTRYGLSEELQRILGHAGIESVRIGPMGPFREVGRLVVLLPLDIRASADDGQMLLTVLDHSVRAPLLSRVCLVWVIAPDMRLDYAIADSRYLDTELFTGGSWRRELGEHQHSVAALRCRDRRIAAAIVAAREVVSATDAESIVGVFGRHTSDAIQSLVCLTDPDIHGLHGRVIEWDSVVAAVYALR